jgi:hypothetical protein
MSTHRPRLPATIAALAVSLAVATAVADPAEVHVYKTPDCGCCVEWMDHLREDGFTVRATDLPDVTPIKLENGVPMRLAACHTAVVGGYVVEGHVPAADIRRLLRERPDIAGLAVPGMPIGSPGMEGPNPEPYRVLAFGARGVTVFAEHGPR